MAQFFGDSPINLVEGVGRGDHVDLGDLKIPHIGAGEEASSRH